MNSADGESSLTDQAIAEQLWKYFILPLNPSLSSHSSRCPTLKVHLEYDNVSFGAQKYY